jgi:YHS domain-containing protein/TusA-related sulfurtransferase
LTILLAFSFVFVLAVAAQQKSDETAVDPVCGMSVKKAEAKATYEYKGTTYYFCSAGCKDAFAKDPEKFLKKQAPEGQAGMMKPGHGWMMHQKAAGEGMKGGCPMMQGKAGEGMACCGKMEGMKAGGCCAECPMMAKDVEKKIENTPDGVVIKVTSKNPETVKKLQEHFAKMGAGCPMMKGAGEKEAPKAERK